jgi:aminopeptidase N
MGYRLTEEVTPWKQAWTRFGAGRKLNGYAADQRPSTHPVAPMEVKDTDAAFSNFDGISYAKGCSALRQLVAWIGDDAFFSGLRGYFDKHAWGNATLADLLDALSQSSGRDLDTWAQVWLRTPQVNTVRPVIGEGGALAIEQTAPQEYPVLRPHRIGIGWRDPGGRWRRTEVEVSGARTELSGVDGSALLLNDGDLTFVKTRMDERTRADLAAVMRAQEDSLSRTVRWASAWDATRDAEWPASEFIELAIATLPYENDVTVLESIFGLARWQAAGRLLPPEGYDAAVASLARTARSILDAAEPGGGHQLAAARALLCAASAEDAGWMRGWLEGDGLPDGLRLDAELRWSVLQRLAVHGTLGEADILDELARDTSARGEQEATKCRASLPDLAAKERAFDIVVREQGLSNRVVAAAGEGLWQPEQSALTESFVERFFVELPRSAAQRSGDLLAMLCRAAYPVFAVSQNTLAAAERALGSDLHPLLRRSMIDETDDLRRSLRAREAARSA